MNINEVELDGLDNKVDSVKTPKPPRSINANFGSIVIYCFVCGGKKQW